MGVSASTSEMLTPRIETVSPETIKSLTFVGAGSEGCVLTDGTSTYVRKVFLNFGQQRHKIATKTYGPIDQDKVFHNSKQRRDWEAHNFLTVLRAGGGFAACIPEEIEVGEVPLEDFDPRQLAKCLSADEENSARAQTFMSILLKTHKHQLVPYVKYPHVGQDLSALCAQRAVSETDLVQAFAGLFCDLAQMKDLGILHLDIKPLNMTGRQQEDGLKLMLIDFGFGGLAGSPNVLKSAEFRLKQPMPEYRYLAPEFYVLHIVYFSASKTWPPPGHRRLEKVESFEDAVAVLHRTGRIKEKIRPRDMYEPVSKLLERFRARSRKEHDALDWLYVGMQAMVTDYFVRVVEMLARAEDTDAVQELLRREVQVLVESWDTYSAAVSCLQTLHDVRPKAGSDLFESVVRLLGASVLTVPATARASVENMDLCEQLQEFSLA